MKTGTCYFPSYGAAMRYYRPYEQPCTTQELRRIIDRKLNEGQIHIGRPALKPGETLSIEDNRYHITSTLPWLDSPAPQVLAKARTGRERGEPVG